MFLHQKCLFTAYWYIFHGFKPEVLSFHVLILGFNLQASILQKQWILLQQTKSTCNAHGNRCRSLKFFLEFTKMDHQRLNEYSLIR